MDGELLTMLLEAWREGRLPLDELQQRLSAHFSPTTVADDVLVDLDRARRCGFPEVVYGVGKTLEQLRHTVRAQQAAGQPSLITRCPDEHAAALRAEFPQAWHNPLARTVRIGALRPTGTPTIGVVTAGSTDRPVAEEAVETATWMGCQVRILQDVGVAGPWRLIERRQELAGLDAVVVIAGMEGALPSVVAGWVRCPVIAVPTSVGYGANLGGFAALLSMLNSCAAHVAVVNIDAGFRGGYLAALIARQTSAGGTDTASP
jgi:NCAIR mutase (PurE)-related protein